MAFTIVERFDTTRLPREISRLLRAVLSAAPATPIHPCFRLPLAGKPTASNRRHPENRSHASSDPTSKVRSILLRQRSMSLKMSNILKRLPLNNGDDNLGLSSITYAITAPLVSTQCGCTGPYDIHTFITLLPETIRNFSALFILMSPDR